MIIKWHQKFFYKKILYRKTGSTKYRMNIVRVLKYKLTMLKGYNTVGMIVICRYLMSILILSIVKFVK